MSVFSDLRHATLKGLALEPRGAVGANPVGVADAGAVADRPHDEAALLHGPLVHRPRGLVAPHRLGRLPRGSQAGPRLTGRPRVRLPPPPPFNLLKTQIEILDAGTAPAVSMQIVRQGLDERRERGRQLRRLR